MLSQTCAQISPALETWVPVLLATFILLTLYVSVVVAWALVQIFKHSTLWFFSGWTMEHAREHFRRHRKEAYRFED